MEATRGLSEEIPVPVGNARTLLQSWSDSRLIEAGAEVWTSGDLTANGTPPVVHGATIFGFGGNHGDSLLALDASTGTVRWRERVLRGSVALSGDRLAVLSETSGLVRLVRAAGDAYHEEARLAVLTPGAPAPGPAAVAGDVVYVRSTEEVAAVRVR
jgi:outer membrane protein assembly factor BamB